MDLRWPTNLLDHTWWPLGAVAVFGLCTALFGTLWMGRRLLCGLVGRPQRPVGGLGYLVALFTTLLMAAVGLGAAGVLLALKGYRTLGRQTRVAEVQCIELSPAHLRLFYVPIERDGRRGPTETYELMGDEWTVSGDLLRFRPFATQLGLEPVFKVTRVEGRWVRAADANHHLPTAFERDGGTTDGWLALYRHAARGPLGWLVASAHGQAVSQLPDRQALYELYMTPYGFVVDKRSF